MVSIGLGAALSEHGVAGVREVNRVIDGMVEAERALLAVPVEGLLEHVLADVTDLEDWEAAASCIERLNARMQLIRAALDERLLVA